MNTPLQIVARYLFLLSLAATTACAMEMKVEGDRLYLSKGIGADDYIKYKETVKGKDIRTVILVNSRGGSVDGALGIAEDLLERNVTTVIAGQCLSACTLIFLAGNERQFSSKYPLPLSALGFHGTSILGDGWMEPRFTSLVYAFYKKRLGQSVAESEINKALSRFSDNKGMAYLYHPKNRDSMAICDGSLGKPCQAIPGKNAYSENIITTLALSDVDIPVEYLPKRELFGADLESLDSVSSATAQESICEILGKNCFSYMRTYASRSNERAFAANPESKWTGSAWGHPDKRIAARRAMHECVKRSNSLCYLFAIGDRFTLPLYASANASSEKAIETLLQGESKLESKDPAVDVEYPMRGLRTVTFNGPTPEKIDGVTEIGTRELVRFLTTRAKVALIDTYCDETTIPTARCIFGAGLASQDLTIDSEIEKNLLAILKGLSPDKQTAIVFLSNNALSWLSANAAYRAVKAGYKVLWYRGGRREWDRKGLPTVPTIPIGAVLSNVG